MKHWALRILAYAAPYWPSVAAMLGLTFVGTGVSLLTPWPIKLIVDYALPGRPLPAFAAWLGVLPGAAQTPGLIAWLAAATVLVVLASRGVQIVAAYIQKGLEAQLVWGLGAVVFSRLQRLPMQELVRRRKGDLVQRVNSDAGCIQKLTMDVCLPVVTALTTLVGMMVVIWRMDPSLALLAIVTLIPLGLAVRRFSNSTAEKAYEQHRLDGEIASLAEQTLSALPMVQAFDRQDHEVGRFRALSGDRLRAAIEVSLDQLRCTAATGAMRALTTAAIMGYGGLHVLDGALSVGGLLVALSYWNQMYQPLSQLSSLSLGYAGAQAKARRVLEILDLPEEAAAAAAPRAGSEAERPLSGVVAFEGVSFGYDPDRPTLRDVSFEAKPGQTIAFVGRTGSGKSTLMGLLLRFYEPWSGRVTVDGLDIRDLPVERLRAAVSIVLQEAFLLPLSVADNIAYGRPDADRADVIRVAQAARAHDFIAKLPAGYDTVIGERGATLSGGERQRLAIARAMLRDPPILILDEPTAALDAETEDQVMEALDALMAGRTTFVIAHRLSSIRRADRILRLDDGRLTECATLQEAASLVSERADPSPEPAGGTLGPSPV